MKFNMKFNMMARATMLAVEKAVKTAHVPLEHVILVQ
jgi:hypothetical protein